MESVLEPARTTLPSAQLSDGINARRVVPLPLVRKLRMHKDSFAGTNKSQFFYGGVGLMLSVGLLDCAIVIYMVVGHTKFGPDLVARQIAGLYNSSDALNHGQPVRMMKPYAIAGAYDESVLCTWKIGTHSLFSPITHIMSYRCVLLIADDGHVHIGNPVQMSSADFEPFDDAGGLYEH